MDFEPLVEESQCTSECTIGRPVTVQWEKTRLFFTRLNEPAQAFSPRPLQTRDVVLLPQKKGKGYKTMARGLRRDLCEKLTLRRVSRACCCSDVYAG